MQSQRQIEKIKADYPAGTRIKLTSRLDDPYTPIPAGSTGTVESVDDAGSIHMRWDFGSSLALIPEIDSFVVEERS